MGAIEVAGGRVHYEDSPADRANAPVLLFVHGSCGGAGQWKHLAGLMSPEFRTVCLDLFAEPFPPRRTWTPQDDARAVAALIDHLDAPVHFVGHSAGCLFSWAALQSRAGRVLSLTLFEPIFFSTLIEIEDPLAEWPRQLADGVRERLAKDDLEGTMAFFVDCWAGRQGAWTAVPDKVKAIMREGAPRLFHEADWIGQAVDLTRPGVPVLLVEGSDTVPAMRAVCRCIVGLWPGTAHQVVPGAGHMAPFSHPSFVAPILRMHVLGAQP